MELVNTWLQFSEDIRHSPAWGMQSTTKSKWSIFRKSTWTVFYLGNDGQVKAKFNFSNPFKACAKMIKMTMDEIGSN
jgi:hypothetical protein